MFDSYLLLNIFSSSPFFLSQTHQLDHSAHYLRLKFLIENKMQHYVPKPEEDIYELVMFMTVVLPTFRGRLFLTYICAHANCG